MTVGFTRLAIGLVNNAASDHFTLTSLIHSSGTRGHTYKLFPHCNHVNLYKYFFSQRIIDTWNSQPAKPNGFSSLARFTRFIIVLHGMQMRSSDENSVCLSVCPSVCQTRGL